MASLVKDAHALIICTGNAINKLPQLSIVPVSDSSTEDLFRAIRGNLSSLIPGLQADDINTMNLGLSHSLSRHKLKFSPDKVDTMIIQAISLLDELDKELNTYAMRVKEWYGWHFPEMAKIINDNLAYARVILNMGYRSNAAEADLAEVLPEEIETAIKAAAEVSMGTEITDEDLQTIQALANEVVAFTEYRQQLSSYLSSRMQAIAPNLTLLVGELVGARLIAHAGSVVNLAKAPASTIQILGAEKALFRALKTKHDTPKYGLIYHASLVGQATGKNKGKIARMLATKAALGLRIDSLADWGVEGENERPEPTDEEKTAVSSSNRIKLERRLRALEGKPLGPRGVAIGPNGQEQPGKFELKEARKYNRDADGISTNAPAAVGQAEKPKLIEEVDGDGVDNDESMEGEEDEPMQGVISVPATSSRTNGIVNGVNGASHGEMDEKQLNKAAKAQRKAERAAKREAKAAKKAAKEMKKASAAINGVDKKRKREDVDAGKSEKKKKRRDAVA